MTDFETPTHPESELLKKYPQSSFIEGAYKDIQKATRNELESLKKKYEWAIKEHEQSVSENKTTMFSDLLSEVENRRQSLPIETPAVRKNGKVNPQIKKDSVIKSTAHDIDPFFKQKVAFREWYKWDITPIQIELSPEIMNDPYWKSLHARMYKNTLTGEWYTIDIGVKWRTTALWFIQFSEEEYQRRISKEVPINNLIAKTFWVWSEIRLGIA